jgi:hypothetical protein
VVVMDQVRPSHYLFPNVRDGAGHTDSVRHVLGISTQLNLVIFRPKIECEDPAVSNTCRV